MRIGFTHGETVRRVRRGTITASLFAAALFGCAAQPGTGEEGKSRGSETKCPTFTRPDTVRLVGGVTVRGCTDRHGNIVCYERGGQLRCRSDDGASLISEGGDW